ncbi:MAG: asparagine--tRNA ligase [Candidatus Eisenbacteria bacterium]|uniref:Asparagine--tRNA ligase n=1 Tax=Eiseniibacteriota bacterium TaxID=2212470 RepID=A0A7Y2E6L7_UNCEI|nr:asparagine--tRNA ligase [Candidatus Eisenbacteria bacterium]
MPSLVSIAELPKHVGEKVQLQGWLYNRRSSKKLQFLLVRDGSAMVQGVLVKDEVAESLWDLVDGLTQESAIRVEGEVREDARSPGGVELGVTGVEVISGSPDYPISLKSHGPEFLLDHRHLWLRSKRPQAVLKVRDEVTFGIRDWLHKEGFINVDSPIFTPNACEGTTTLFETEYFGSQAFLTQSGQLYNEASAMAFGKVFCFGPTFRAEKSKTRRHLTEFWMVEPEVAFMGLDDLMTLIENFVGALVARVLENCAEELKVLERDTAPLERAVPPFPRLSYPDAAEILRGGDTGFEDGGDFGSPDETELSSRYDRPLLVHRFPSAIKAFYMKEDPADPKLSLSVDLLAPEGYGEIVGGGQREESLEVIERKIKEHDLPKEAFEWYLDLRRYGSVPHSGFGMGIERAVSWICGLGHLREAIPFPRMIHRLSP